MESKHYEVCVAGVGAVGSLLTAMLGRSSQVHLNLIARGARAEALRKNGVVLHSEAYGELTATPARIVENGSFLPAQDLVLVTVKNYSLDQIAEQLKLAIGPETVIIPVMNGVEAGDRLRALFPQAVVCDALIYTVTGVNPDYSATQKGSYTYLYVGSKIAGERQAAGAKLLYELLKSVGFDVRWSDDIESEIWQKFVLNCAFNTITARYLINTSEIRRDAHLQEDFHALLSEACTVGRREGVTLPEDLVEQKFRFMMEKQSENATSSLRRDVEAHRPTELDTFLGAILRKAKKSCIDVPVSACYYCELMEIISKYE